jgi:hypothetical protein
MVIKLERYRTTMPQRILLHHVACSCRIHADFLSRYLALIIHCHFDIKQTDHQNLECWKTKLIFFKQKTLECRSTTYLRSLHWNFKQNSNRIAIPCPTFKSHGLYAVLTRETPIRCEDEEDLRTVGNLYKIME